MSPTVVRRRDLRRSARRSGLVVPRAALSVVLVVSISAFASVRPVAATATAPIAVGITTIAGGTTTLAALAGPSDAPTVPDALDRATSAMELASRSTSRDALTGCSGTTAGLGQNGRLPASELCALWQHPYQDRADAVVTLDALNDAYRARFGTDMCLSSGYRDLEKQSALRAAKGSLAAPAGQSNHGWGLAVDFCASTYTGTSGKWLRTTGPIFGWDNPAWAHSGGGGPYEPWHWEFTSGVAKLAAATTS
ncbi:M15 family metallopeptidase [Cellulomonas sp.]